MMKIWILIGMIALLLACAPVEQTDDHNADGHVDEPGDHDIDLPPTPEPPGDTVSKDNDGSVDVANLTPEVCNAAGGHWNDCGSPCAGTGADFCIQSCEAMCECGGIAGFGCPEGYSCLLSGKITDEIGRCIVVHARG
jgi:hypothetical protein